MENLQEQIETILYDNISIYYDTVDGIAESVRAICVLLNIEYQDKNKFGTTIKIEQPVNFRDYIQNIKKYNDALTQNILQLLIKELDDAILNNGQNVHASVANGMPKEPNPD